MRVLVTGGAGFIGANVVERLQKDPGVESVRVIDDLSTGRRSNLDGLDPERLTFFEGSILDRELLSELLHDVDAVVHLAARPSVPRSIEDPVATNTANVTGTLHLLEEVRSAEISHVVVASSSSVYGSNPSLPKHEGLATAPMSPYAVSKLATENYSLAYANCYDLPVLAFRFFNVFGPLQPADHAYAAAVPAFVSHALRDEPIPIYGDGHQTRDFTYVGSVADVIADALRRRVTAPGPVNLAFGTRRSLLEVVADLEEQLGRPVDVRHTDPRPGDVRHSQADDSRVSELFPDVLPTEFEEGLRRTIAWIRAELER